MAGGAGRQVLRRTHWEHAYVMSFCLTCPVSPGLWRVRRAAWKNPLRNVRRNWDFGGGLFGPRVQHCGHGASKSRNHAPSAGRCVQHGSKKGGHDLRSEVRTDLHRWQASEAQSSRWECTKSGGGERKDPAKISRVKRGDAKDGNLWTQFSSICPWLAYFPPIRSHEIPRVLAYQGDVEKVFTFCFLFLGDPAQNSGFGANTKWWHAFQTFSLMYIWVVGMVPRTYCTVVGVWAAHNSSTFSKVATRKHCSLMFLEQLCRWFLDMMLAEDCRRNPKEAFAVGLDTGARDEQQLQRLLIWWCI